MDFSNFDWGNFTLPSDGQGQGDWTIPGQDGQGQGGWTIPGQDGQGQQGGWTMPGGQNGGQNGGWGFSWDDSGHDLGLDFSAKGMKAGNGDAEIGGTIAINGGTININSTD